MNDVHLGINIDLSRDSLLDEIGRQRLLDSYMMEGETSPQHRYAYVSKAFSSNPEHAQRLYEYSSKHWLGYSTPILSFGRNKVGLPISCLTDNNYIHTKASGAVTPSQLRIGDYVLTHKGRWKRVIAIKQSDSSDLWCVQAATRTTKTEITGNHPVLTNRGWIRVDQLSPFDLIAVNDVVESVETPYTITDLNAYYDFDSRGANTGRFDATKLPAEVEVTPELAWALGLWFAEGSTHGNAIHLTMSVDELPVIQRWVDIMETHFGVSGNVNQTTRKSTGHQWSSGYVSSAVLMSWFNAQFGVGCTSKRITEWLLDLPNTHVHQFYEAFYLGDGYKTTKQRAFGISNPGLTCGLYHMLLKLGRPVSLNLTKKAGKLSSVRWTCEIRETVDKTAPSTQRSRVSTGIPFTDGNRYVPIKSLTKINGSAPVWDIQVEDDESFTVNGLIVHNCFLVNVHDSKEGLVEALSETNWLSMLGGGVGVYFGTRGADEKSVGVIPHMGVYDRSSLAYKQGTTRRGSYAMYLDISHPDIMEFLDMRKETGDQNRRSQNLHHGVNIPDAFMEIIERCMHDASADDSWELRDPTSGKLHETVSARDLWVRILELRAGQGRGEPYIHYIDNVNRAVRPILRERGYKVVQSNLCSEIELMTDKDTTAVCCLSSINMEHWDEYKDNHQFFHDILEMLDNVLEYFIQTAPPQIKRAIKSAVEERSIGLGVMGFHSYLQKNNIAFDSAIAKSTNIKMFKKFQQHTERANLDLGAERGSPKWLEGTGLRFAHTSALAPTASNALICGNVSPSAEAWRANAFRQDTLSGTFIQKNKFLDAIIKAKAERGECVYEDAWLHIVQHEGSVSTLDCLTDDQKQVYKTASEIDQLWAVEHVTDRQPYIDQGQSFNIYIRPDISIAKLHAIHFSTWKKGGKAMYYVRTEKLANTDTVGKRVARVRIEEEVEQLRLIAEGMSCVACEG